MRVSLRVLLTTLCLVLFLPFWPIRAAEPPRPLRERPLGQQQGVEVRAWTYLSDGLRVKGRLYLPNRDGRRPVVVFNHDGISGISREHHLSSLRLARRGYVVFSPSYRGEDGSEGMVEIAKGEVRDVLNALPLLRGLPEADPDRIAMVGASHGALISLLAASREPQIAGVVFAYGVADLPRWWHHLKARGKLGRDPITRRTYGDGPQDRPESFRIRNAVDQLAGLQAPVLILQGLLDEITPPEQAHLLKKALDRQGVSNRIHLYPDALHGFLVYAPYLTRDVTPQEKAQAEAAWGEVFRFLEEVFNEPSPT
jgi:dipeptidyl aminopeptidase/acylaminoacyl peptidase